MIIALDFDETYTRDMDFWNTFLHNAKERSHRVFCVTMRYKHEGDEVIATLGNRVEAVYFTGRRGKKKFMYEQGHHIDIWIDDTPAWILNDAAQDLSVDVTQWDSEKWTS
jgi:hypothetical protein